MNPMKNTILIICLSLFFSACGSEQDQVDALEKEVLALHDEVMPKLDDVMSLKARIATQIHRMDSLENEGITGNKLAEERIKLNDITQKLTDSDEMMMNWMRNYKGDSAKKLKPEAAIQYFNTEKEKMLEVQNFTTKSINDAKAILN
jgi:PBP1b-binding outer membrane lipoprotein LpoB